MAHDSKWSVACLHWKKILTYVKWHLVPCDGFNRVHEWPDYAYLSPNSTRPALTETS